MSNAFNTGEFRIASAPIAVSSFTKSELIHLITLVSIAAIDANRIEDKKTVAEMLAIQTKLNSMVQK